MTQTCAQCAYYRQQMDRLQAETLALRLQVADGPRSRVAELERTVAALNATISDLNSKLRYRKQAS